MENLIEKIRKLFRLAERAGTEAESETAMRKAHELLAVHKLSMADLKTGATDKVTQEEYQLDKKYGWKHFLFGAASRLCFCHMIVLNRSRRVRFVGKPIDILTAKNLADYLLKTGLRLSRKLPVRDRRYRNSWRIGFAHRVAERVEALVQLAMQNKLREEGTGKELILSPLYTQAERDIGEFIRENYGRLGGGLPNPRAYDRAGYQDGMRAGNDVSLSLNNVENKSVKTIGY